MKLFTINKPKYISPTIKKKGKNLFWTLLFPLIGVLFLVTGSLAGGYPIIGNSITYNSVLITMITVLIACFALNTNLNSGRMDFSLGSVGILACVLAFKTLPDKTMDGFAIIYLLLAVVYGILLGTISGLIFVTLKIPAIVVSLGVCLIFEGFAYVLTDGKGSVDQSGAIAPSLYPLITNPWFMLIIVVGISFFMLLTLKYSKFGHDKLSILFGQKVAVDTGVKEIKNAMICYALAGALIAVYTYIISIYQAKVTISTNLGTAMTVLQNFLPIFLGGLIAKHSNEVIGLICGVFSVTLFKEGLIRFGVDSSTISLITSLLIFVVLTYMVNWTNWVRAIKNKITNYKLSYIKKTKNLKEEEKE